jgi:iron complex transport system ATP-binding protein
MADTGITVNGLTVGYGQVPVLDGVSFGIDGGKVVALLGPNGSGKTTLLLAMGGLIRPAAGTVRIGGTQILGLKAAERARLVAVLPQGLPTFIPFTVAETVLMGRYPLSSPILFYGARDVEETEKLLRATDLWGLRERRCSELSGGELQRVMLASVFAQQTPVLLLDEPTASMDVRQQMNIMAMILEMAAGQHKTVVIATHDLALVSGMCERVVMIMGRREVVCGEKAAVMTEENVRRLFGVRVTAHRAGKETFFFPDLEGGGSP